MQHFDSATPEQVRQMIFNRARQMSQQITTAAEEAGERSSAQRRHLEEQQMSSSHSLEQGLIPGGSIN